MVTCGVCLSRWRTSSRIREPLRGLLEDELVAARVDLHGATRRDERLHLGHDVGCLRVVERQDQEVGSSSVLRLLRRQRRLLLGLDRLDRRDADDVPEALRAEALRLEPAASAWSHGTSST
jgi:hypothetical protein